jgi:hypothetical protein
MNQQSKDRPCQLLGRTQEEGKEHLSSNYSRKREGFPTAIVEYGEKEVRELLALERPQKKKDNNKLMCFNCKELDIMRTNVQKRTTKQTVQVV